ncbi:hypothetical protein BHQ21_22895 [Mycobacterium sherrisii]|uniref:HTH araC/xylS-type domain-containing protein n=2 Tax=Mycobacterium sherrisii TaxID=243061 RepID=A0A1E3SIH5_9MYCO|nr:hypothetical protein BHQ21_22895 [Mycobacterium sherrisii]
MTMTAGAWAWVRSLDDFAALHASPAWWPDIKPTPRAGTLSFTHRSRRLGPITVLDVDFHNKVRVNGGDNRPHYHVTLPVATHAGGNGLPLYSKPSPTVYRPEGDAAVSDYSGRLLAVMIDRCAVEDALANVLGRPITSQIDCRPTMPAGAQPVLSWMRMVSLFAEQLFQPGSAVHQPMVGMPFVESVVHGLLLAADHPYRAALQGAPTEFQPRAVRAAVAVMEAEADQPLTVSALAALSYVSVRALQEGFRRYYGVTPMAYLREVRLRRAHRMLLDSDPAAVTVAGVAHRWGFTNAGRFAALHAARYHEAPSETLRRNS